MDILWYGLKVAVVGMLVVFVGLIILIGCVKALKGLGKKEAPAKAGPPAPPLVKRVEAPAPPAPAAAPLLPIRDFTPGPALTRKDGALYAVISGAIAQTLAAEGINPEGGFTITSVTPVNDPAAPKLTVKDSVLYAVITAAIAQTLAAEGVSPETGFTIQSVRAV